MLLAQQALLTLAKLTLPRKGETETTRSPRRGNHTPPPRKGKRKAVLEGRGFKPIFSMIKDEDRQTTGANRSVVDQINSLKREDERLYNILAIDVWALAKTMDEYQPGFWAAFMKNREKALKRFLAEMIKNKPTDTKRPPFLR